MTDYKDLEVWKKSMDLVESIYNNVVQNMPESEKYGLTDQIKRCVVSIPLNIAEGSGRNTTKQYIRFLYISMGSCCELETILLICERLGFIKNISSFMDEIKSIKMMLNALITSLKNKLRITKHEQRTTKSEV